MAALQESGQDSAWLNPQWNSIQGQLLGRSFLARGRHLQWNAPLGLGSWMGVLMSRF